MKAQKITIESTGPIDFEKFKEFLRFLSVESYRIKGYITTAQGNFNVDCVRENIKVLPNSENNAQKSAIVIIFQDYALREVINADWTDLI